MLRTAAPKHRANRPVDSCRNLNHGIGLGPCRIHNEAAMFGRFQPRHADTPVFGALWGSTGLSFL